VDIKDDCITVNGYGIFEETVYSTTAEGSSVTYPYTVPDNSVFVLNDFRSDPEDSRTYGAIPRSDVEGEVIFILRRRGI
jgi:signal peptidase I